MDIHSTIVIDVLRAYNAFYDFNRQKMSDKQIIRMNLGSYVYTYILYT